MIFFWRDETVSKGTGSIGYLKLHLQVTRLKPSYFNSYVIYRSSALRSFALQKIRHLFSTTTFW